jgi:penicillin V acylase-like amidase (Ntn superfamily)
MEKRIFIFILNIFTFFLIFPKEIFACTIFYTIDKKGHILVGRNFDNDRDGGRIWFITPRDGLHGMVILEQLGTNMPYEGMNDAGLFIGISAVPNTMPPLSPFKPIRISLEMVKIVLERAKTVDEALNIFPKYYVVFGTFLGNPMVHYMIVDKEGNSAILEYIDGKMVVIKNNTDSKVMTNHFISKPELGSDSKTSFERYKIAKENLNNVNSVDDAYDLLRRVNQKTTVWSTVYNLNEQKIYLCYKNSSFVFDFNLKEELSKGTHGYDLSLMNLENPLIYKETKHNFTLRIHFGSGYIEEKNDYFGVSFLISSLKDKKYGIELTKFKDFIGIGIIFEKRYFEWLHLSMGIMRYSENMGFNFKFGWEPDNHIPFKPFLALRQDFILENPIKRIFSINTGFNFEF